LRPLVISESAPARITRTRFGEPALTMAARKPADTDNTATNTMTTPAMPTIATADELMRRGIVRMLSIVTASVCLSQLMSVSPQSVDNAEAHRRQTRHRARDGA